jgi:hypothetical protein
LTPASTLIIPAPAFLTIRSIRQACKEWAQTGTNRYISALFRKNTRFDVTSAWAKSSFSSVLIIFAAGAPVAGQARKLRHIWGEVDRKVLNRPKQHW